LQLLKPVHFWPTMHITVIVFTWIISLHPKRSETGYLSDEWRCRWTNQWLKERQPASLGTACAAFPRPHTERRAHLSRIGPGPPTTISIHCYVTITTACMPARLVLRKLATGETYSPQRWRQRARIPEKNSIRYLSAIPLMNQWITFLNSAPIHVDDIRSLSLLLLLLLS